MQNNYIILWGTGQARTFDHVYFLRFFKEDGMWIEVNKERQIQIR